MKLALDRREATLGSVDASVSGVFERSDKPEPLPRSLLKEEAAIKGVLAQAWEKREIRGRRKELTILHRPDGRGRVVLIGLGPTASYTPDILRRAAAEV